MIAKKNNQTSVDNSTYSDELVESETEAEAEEYTMEKVLNAPVYPAEP